jgi:hypothetical protein
MGGKFMNVREGMRRLGIVLGVVGCAIGILFGYESARQLWDVHTAHQRFESLMASPTMLSLAKQVRWFSTENRKKAGELAADPEFLKLSDDEQKYILGLAKDQGFSPTLTGAAPSDENHIIDVQVNLEGVKKVNVDKFGRISLIELSTGESIPRTEPPTLMAFVGLLLYPISGFLAPWGAIRVLVWLGAGFLSK